MREHHAVAIAAASAIGRRWPHHWQLGRPARQHRSEPANTQLRGDLANVDVVQVRVGLDADADLFRRVPYRHRHARVPDDDLGGGMVHRRSLAAASLHHRVATPARGRGSIASGESGQRGQEDGTPSQQRLGDEARHGPQQRHVRRSGHGGAGLMINRRPAPIPGAPTKLAHPPPRAPPGGVPPSSSMHACRFANSGVGPGAPQAGW